MADLTRIYQGPLPRGRIFGRRFAKGEPFDVSEDEAAQLDTDADWAKPKAQKNPAVPKSQGATPTSKEP